MLEADEPVVDEPAAEEPVAEEPVAEEPVVGEPAADEPVVGELVAGELVDAPDFFVSSAASANTGANARATPTISVLFISKSPVQDGWGSNARTREFGIRCNGLLRKIRAEARHAARAPRFARENYVLGDFLLPRAL